LRPALPSTDIDRRFALQSSNVPDPAHGPRKGLWIVPSAGTAGHEELRHLLGIHVLLNCGIAGRAYRAKNQQDLVAFDQFSRLFDRLGWAIGVIVGDEVDLAPIDAAFRVDLLK